MTTGGKTEQIRPAGASQFDQLLGQQQSNNNTLQGQWGGINSQINSMLPQTNVLSPQFQNQLSNNVNNTYNQQLGYLNKGYNGQEGFDSKFRSNMFGNIARFGGLNNSIARDNQGQLQSYYNQALGDLGTRMFGYQQGLQSDQLANQQTGLSNYMDYQKYIDEYGTKNYLPTLGAAPAYQGYSVKTPGTNWGQLGGAAIGAVGGAFLGNPLMGAQIGSTIGSAI